MPRSKTVKSQIRRTLAKWDRLEVKHRLERDSDKRTNISERMGTLVDRLQKLGYQFDWYSARWA